METFENHYIYNPGKTKAGQFQAMRNLIKSLLLRLVVAATMLLPFSSLPHSAELIMMEQKACEWCERWHEEIGVIYNKTAEGKIAPLRIVDIHEEWPEDLKDIQIERFTPTFVLIENGEEVDRMRGYTGDEFFWFLIGEMIKKLPKSFESQG